MNSIIAIGLTIIGLVHLVCVPFVKTENTPSPTGGAVMFLVSLIEFTGAWIIFTI